MLGSSWIPMIMETSIEITLNTHRFPHRDISQLSSMESFGFQRCMASRPKGDTPSMACNHWDHFIKLGLILGNTMNCRLKFWEYWNHSVILYHLLGEDLMGNGNRRWSVSRSFRTFPRNIHSDLGEKRDWLKLVDTTREAFWSLCLSSTSIC